MGEFIDKPELVIFLVTIVSYISSFLVYGGYLSAFAGSVGNTPFAFSDFTIVDILAILPIALITLLNKILLGLKDVLKFLAIYFAVPFSVGLGVRIGVGQFVFPPFTTAAVIFGMILWTGATSYGSIKNYRFVSWQNLVLWLITVIGWTIIFGSVSTSGQPTLVPAPNSLISILNGILMFFYIIVGLLGLFVLGYVTAETVVERKALSKISRLVLSQPIELLGKAEQTTIESKVRTSKKGFWHPAKPGVIEYNVFTYSYPEDKPLFLVSSFRNFSLFYICDDNKDKTMNGQLISVASQLIYSYELFTRHRNLESKTRK